MPDRDEIRAAVHDELQRFARHMRETIVDGKAYDDWFREGLDWLIDDV